VKAPARRRTAGRDFCYSAIARIAAAWEEFLSEFDLRPLSLGEILDRTFTLYRKHFLLFFGIAAIPQILVLAASLIILYIEPERLSTTNPFAIFSSPSFLAVTIISTLIALVAYVFAQGASIISVSEIYLGRQITIGEALGKIRPDFWFLLGVILLSALVILVGTALLIIPGIYLACRLIICLPSALIEDKGPAEALSRSFRLTKGFAGRSFMIYVIYLVIAIVLGLLVEAPFSILLATAAANPTMIRIWAALAQVGSSASSAIVMPILMIATAIFYYDLRVRKEAFDIQFLMNPDLNPPSPPAMPSIL
jgi:hypothetical protein